MQCLPEHNMHIFVIEGLHTGHSAPGREPHVEKRALMHHPQQTKQHHLVVLGHWGVVADAGMPKLCGIEVLQDVGKDVVWHTQRRVLQVTGQEGLELAGTKDCAHLIGFCPVP